MKEWRTGKEEQIKEDTDNEDRHKTRHKTRLTGEKKLVDISQDYLFNERKHRPTPTKSSLYC